MRILVRSNFVNTLLGSLRNGVLAALFLTSCSNNCGEQWCCITQQVSPSQYSSRKIYLPANHGFNQMEIELVQTACTLRMYIDSHGLEIPADPDDPYSALVYVSFKSHSYTTRFDRLVGGHRLLVPDPVRDQIVEHLLSGQAVYIRVGSFEADISPEKFAAIYSK